MKVRALQLLANSYLPEDARDYNMDFSAKGLNKLLYYIATTHGGSELARVNKALSDIGMRAAYVNGETMTLDDLAPVIDRQAFFDAMDKELSGLKKSDPGYEDKRDAIFQKYNVAIEKATSEEAMKRRNNIALSVLSGSRGSPSQLKAMTSTPGTYSDYLNKTVPVFSRRSFAEGVAPVVFLAGAYGTRRSVSSTKRGTAKGGDIAKQFAQVAANMVVRKEDCGTGNGIAMDVDDTALKGRALAAPVGGYRAGEFITPSMLRDLERKGVKRVVARSPLTCSVENGLCAKCMGRLLNGGKLPRVGDHVGAITSTSVTEPIAQAALNEKHTGGMTSGKRTYAGLDTIIQFTQSPEKFKDRAAVAETDGRVEAIEDAPQGGKYITVAGRKHYVPTGHEPEVKVGDTVEAGDFLSEGLGDVEDVVRHKGVGAGRLYYANRLNKILADSGAASDKRLTEVLARAAVNHVRIVSDEGYGNYLPDDVVEYSALQHAYRMPETSKPYKVGQAVGKYLQQPVLHYTIGTRITPGVAKDLESVGYQNVYADDTAPGFEPEMVRLRGASHSNPDWMASQGTSYLTRQIGEAVERGDDTEVYSNQDWRPRMAYGVDFAKNVRKTGEF